MLRQAFSALPFFYSRAGDSCQSKSYVTSHFFFPSCLRFGKVSGLNRIIESQKGIKMIDRSKASQALAKAIAYKQCGKDADAAEWARKLVEILECAEILK